MPATSVPMPVVSLSMLVNSMSMIAVSVPMPILSVLMFVASVHMCVASSLTCSIVMPMLAASVPLLTDVVPMPADLRPCLPPCRPCIRGGARHMELPDAEAAWRVRILTVNVTALTKARAEVVLECACKHGVEIVCLQETRHVGHAPWLASLCRQRGWAMEASPEPPLSRCGRFLRNGGTIMLWSLGLGRSRAAESDDHRRCERVFEHACVSNLYGPAAGADCEWVAANVRRSIERELPVHIHIGDFNWKGGYLQEYAGWSMAEHGSTTIGSAAAPTRCLVHGDAVVKYIAGEALPGVPHHEAVVYEIRGAPQCAAWQRRPDELRLRRTAAFRWLRPLLHGEADVLKNLIPESLAECDDEEATMQEWHRCAESVFMAAVGIGAAELVTKPERPKGSQPSTRPVCATARGRPARPVAVSRLLRLHRAAEHQRKFLGGASPLTHSQRRHWASAVRCGLLAYVAADQDEAVSMLTDAVTEYNVKAQQAKSRAWRRSFDREHESFYQSARAAFRPQSVPNATVSEEMAAYWKGWWVQERSGGELAAAWGRLADEAHFLEDSVQAAWVEPTWEEFCAAARQSSGAPGFDGWSSEEIRAAAEHVPWLLRPVYDVLQKRMRYDAERPSFDNYAVQRVVGIPKRQSDEMRPISVASVLLRCWHKVLAKQLPEASRDQYCGRRGMTVTKATHEWARQPGRCGCELDLAKAFDSIDHQVAKAALRRSGVAECIVQYLAKVWAAPRLCCVAGCMAVPLRPNTGIPAGDPLSPRILDAVLALWAHMVRREVPEAVPYMYMDDRSVKVLRCRDTVDEEKVVRDQALEVTIRFDAAAGLVENMAKRQMWSTDGSEQGDVEHLGLRFGMAGRVTAPKPRDDWQGLRDGLKTLEHLPGSGATRECLAAVFLSAKWHWAAPLMALPPADLSKVVMQSVLQTRCTWWCRGRWFAERLNLHPVASTAILALRRCGDMAQGAGQHLRAAVAASASWLRLRVSWAVDGAPWLHYTGDDDRLLRSLAELAHAQGRAAIGEECRRFRAAPCEKTAHVLRILARAKVLSEIPATRLDREGCDRIDLEAQSAPEWQDWKKTLSDAEAKWLRIWRSGAVRTPTRRHHDEEDHSKCRSCGVWASMRHFWAECPVHAQARDNLSLQYGLPAGWWNAQPRVTAKSGWVTIAAGPTVAARARFQVAAARMAFVIFQSGGGLDDGTRTAPAGQGGVP
jgi:hypothetical protein